VLPLEFFRRRAYTIANLDYCLMYAALAGVLFFVSLYFQNVKGFSALETGFSWLTMNVPFILVSPFAGRLQGRFGSRRVVVVGALLAGLGCSTLRCSVSTRRFSRPFPAISSSAAGVLNTARQVGSAVGLAALGSIATAAAAGSLTKPDNFVSGMRAAMLVAGALALAASVLTLVGQPRATRRAAG
jgi:MFS transporter, DHA2 family, methylenomycin A resistance protein